jgi:hypothetical protein
MIMFRQGGLSEVDITANILPSLKRCGWLENKNE